LEEGILTMFSGIVRGTYPVIAVEAKTGLLTVEVSLDPALLSVLEVGASIAVDGVCLTVTRLTSETACFDIMMETIRVTTLRDLKVGDSVNIEPSLTTQRDISGHIVSGHVDTTARVIEVQRPDENNCTLLFEAPPPWIKYIFPKGFIALNGCSLTVGWVDKKASRFSVYLIPETMRRTTFGGIRVDDLVNVEVERQTQVIVDTISEFMERFEKKLPGGAGGSSVETPSVDLSGLLSDIPEIPQ
jgi:riboflavin synthase